MPGARFGACGKSPGTSSEQMLNLCLDPRTQAAYQSPCPTYEPAG